MNAMVAEVSGTSARSTPSAGKSALMLGVRIWYGFFGTVLETADAFEAKVEELCRELGIRGRVV